MIYDDEFSYDDDSNNNANNNNNYNKNNYNNSKINNGNNKLTHYHKMTNYYCYCIAYITMVIDHDSYALLFHFIHCFIMNPLNDSLNSALMTYLKGVI